MAKVRRPINIPVVRRGNNPMIIIALLIAVAAGAYLYSSGGIGGDSAGSAGGEVVSAYALPVPAHGPDDAPVILAKWTDFQ